MTVKAIDASQRSAARIAGVIMSAKERTANPEIS